MNFSEYSLLELKHQDRHTYNLASTCFKSQIIFILGSNSYLPICKPMKSVCGLDVHKDSVYLCILNEFGELIKNVFGVLTYQLEALVFNKNWTCLLINQLVP